MSGGLKWSQLELAERLGEGKAGAVWKARLTEAVRGRPRGALVAVKSYKPWVLDQAGAFERIHRELEVGRTVRHPNVVSSLGVVSDVHGRPALVMDFYEGETLESTLESDRAHGRKRSLEWITRILSGLCRGLDALHGAGVVHRDLKPANVLVQNGVPIIMDLGVTKVSVSEDLTESGQFLGTIRYAEPEYLLGEDPAPATDRYSLGAVAAEVLSGGQFLGHLNQWARLVAAKSKGERSLPDSYHLAKCYGIGFADFAGFQCRGLLASRSQRFVDLAALADLIERRVWERPFFIQSNRFSRWQTEPLKERFLEHLPLLDFPEDCDQHPSQPTSFEETWHQIRTALSPADLELLRKLVAEHYWSGWWEDWWEDSWNEMKPLVDAHAVLWRQRNDDFLFKLAEAVRIAHRLGYV